MNLKFEDLPDAIGQLLEQNNEILEILRESGIYLKPKEQILTLEGICDLLDLKRQTIYSYVSKGIIPYYKKAGKLYFIRDEIENWIVSKQKLSRIGGVVFTSSRNYKDRGVKKKF
ncbi:helix-turn-helix domain-containing protein [Echinicola marina]|uniref:helix-turn-helix transcriptional regulator n=1 Tax=Echinicola marina TaxID=2859768 RepID=UPI001CF60AA1|nr:helix-turn-helix domain-containing protein [Echinicola marina]UCS92205.1 helix-turn-helix domain-containing protein [Echinicola marina]